MEIVNDDMQRVFIIWMIGYVLVCISFALKYDYDVLKLQKYLSIPFLILEQANWYNIFIINYFICY